MKKLYFLFFLILPLIKNVSAQNTCSTPFEINGGTSNSFSLITGTPNNDNSNDYGCLTSQSNVTWLYFKVCVAGNIDFTINASGSSANDVDFVAWGPLTSPSDCGLTSTQIVDCGFSGGSFEYANFTSTVAGQYYKIMISNNYNTAGTFTINQSSGVGQLCDTSSFGCNGFPLSAQEICKVSTDPLINHNFIYWNKDTNFYGNYNIQKETTTANVYNTLATLTSSDTSVYEDMTSNPMIQSFKYRIEAIDTCGHSLVSYAHQTIHLLTSTSTLGYPQLDWNAYSGFNYSTFFIYRGSSAANLSLYDSISVSFTTYTDVSPMSGMNYYSIAVFPPTPCMPSRSSDECFSNVSPVFTTSIKDFSLSDIRLSPNPASDELHLSTQGNYSFISVDLFDVAGRRIITKTFQNNTSLKIDLSQIGNGFYVTKITTDKGVTQRNIIVAK
jgi:hypothetical protein